MTDKDSDPVPDIFFIRHTGNVTGGKVWRDLPGLFPKKIRSPFFNRIAVEKRVTATTSQRAGRIYRDL